MRFPPFISMRRRKDHAVSRHTDIHHGWHPSSQFIDVDGWRAHFVEMGDPAKSTVLLLHGYLLSSWAWRNSLDALARNHHVIALCHKGFGYTEKRRDPYTIQSLADFVSAFARRIELDRAHLVGHSMGGAVAILLALDTSLVDRLVLVDSAGLRWKVPLGLASFPFDRLSAVVRLIARRPVLRRLLQSFAYRNMEVDSEYMEGFLRPLRAPGSVHAALKLGSGFIRSLEEISPRIPAIQNETLILWGRHDVLVPARGGEIMAAMIRNSQLQVFEECGHCPHEENTPAFNDAVLGFLG